MPVTLNRATADDEAALLEMMQQLRRDDPMSNTIWPRTVLALRELLGNAGLGSAFLVRHEGRTVGYAVLAYSFSLEFGGRDGFVDELLIMPEWRGRGLGGKAVEVLVSEARREGLRTLNLEMTPGNPAERLYVRTGFTDRGYRLLTRYLEEA